MYYVIINWNEDKAWCLENLSKEKFCFFHLSFADNINPHSGHKSRPVLTTYAPQKKVSNQSSVMYVLKIFPMFGGLISMSIRYYPAYTSNSVYSDMINFIQNLLSIFSQICSFCSVQFITNKQCRCSMIIK